MIIIIYAIIGAVVGFFIAIVANFFIHKVRIGNLDLNNIDSSIKQITTSQLNKIIATHFNEPNKLVSIINPAKQTAFIKPYIETHVDHFLNHKLTEKVPAISMFVGPPTIAKLKEGIMEEFDVLAPSIIHDSIHKYGTAENLSSLGEKLINNLDNITITKYSNIILKKIQNYLLIGGIIIGAITGTIGGLLATILI